MAVKITKEEAEYMHLVAKVAAINEEVADYMSGEALTLDDFRYSGDLAECFVWSDTPYPVDLWRIIEDGIKPA